MEDKSKYNETFAIPEMVKTFKSLCNRLQRDVLFVGGLALYIFIIGKFEIPGIKYLFEYRGMNIVVVFIIFFILYLSINHHIAKIYLLYHQIDDEVKRFLSKSANSLRQAIDCASHMTAFVISENMISDFVLVGHKRFPSLRRYLVVNSIVTIVAIIMTCKMLRDFGSSLNPFFVLIAYIGISYLLMKYFFIKRAAFLFKTDLGKEVVYQYNSLLIALSMGGKVENSNYSSNEINLIKFINAKLNEFKMYDLLNLPRFNGHTEELGYNK